METTEGTYKFYKDDRERIKGRSMLPTETLRYIEALEKIADAAIDLWRVTPHGKSELVASCANDLYDAITVVNWLNDDL